MELHHKGRQGDRSGPTEAADAETDQEVDLDLTKLSHFNPQLFQTPWGPVLFLDVDLKSLKDRHPGILFGYEQQGLLFLASGFTKHAQGVHKIYQAMLAIADLDSVKDFDREVAGGMYDDGVRISTSFSGGIKIVVEDSGRPLKIRIADTLRIYAQGCEVEIGELVGRAAEGRIFF